MASLVPNIPLPSLWTTPLTHRMTELVDQSCCAVNTCLNYFASFRPRDIRQILDFLGVHHCEVLFGILAFVLFQFTKFTAILLLAVFLAYCIFYWWDTFFPGLSQRESGSSRRDQYAPSYLASFPNTTEKAEYRDELTNARLPPFYGTTSTEPSPANSDYGPNQEPRGSRTPPQQTMRNNEAQTISTTSSTTDPEFPKKKMLVPMVPQSKLVGNSSSGVASKRESRKIPEQNNRKSLTPPIDNTRRTPISPVDNFQNAPPSEKSSPRATENFRKSSTPLSENSRKSSAPLSENSRKSSTPPSDKIRRISTPTPENNRSLSLDKTERVSDQAISTPVFSHNGTTPRSTLESSTRNRHSSNQGDERLNRRSQYPYRDHEQARGSQHTAGVGEFRSRRVSDDPAQLRRRPGSLEEQRHRRPPHSSSQDEGRAGKQRRPGNNRSGVTRRQYPDEAIERLRTNYRELPTQKIPAPISSEGAYYNKLHSLLPSNRNHSERHDQHISPSNRNNSERRDLPKNSRNNNLDPDSGNRNRSGRPNPPHL
ncbi:serine/arginine repetitive matrix protein 1 isoform X1 [Drosophila pseudoobscura]|uniref:Serine/arginine repetitive matrix protein 1 isoform X1 n=1 Tax=Drosophila pseudoobscura pseudoobscura TaxID=46245 RepID=A0A6I8VDA8_DROPS|nr:serine/arginine repetitive matrix protein 1 isoform X1 [Drosophila pseudoobscura]XP_033241842.1 serine/arginine repetitive matrix protein 1 isoform X1 [Drosophila pseudoobscura]